MIEVSRTQSPPNITEAHSQVEKRHKFVSLQQGLAGAQVSFGHQNSLFLTLRSSQECSSHSSYPTRQNQREHHGKLSYIFFAIPKVWLFSPESPLKPQSWQSSCHVNRRKLLANSIAHNNLFSLAGCSRARIEMKCTHFKISYQASLIYTYLHKT